MANDAAPDVIIQRVCASNLHRIERVSVPGGWLYVVFMVGPTGNVAIHTTFVAEDRPSLAIPVDGLPPLPFVVGDVANRAEPTVSIPPADPTDVP